MKYIVLLVLLTSIRVCSVFAQDNTETVNEKAERIIFVNFLERLDSSNYLLYNLEDKYLIIEKRDKDYILFFIRESIGIEDSVCINKRNKILNIAFNPKSCFVEYPNEPFDIKSPHPHSRYIYFFLREKGIRYCEFTLPALFNEDVSGKKVYPIDERVHEFLIKKMFTHWTN